MTPVICCRSNLLQKLNSNNMRDDNWVAAQQRKFKSGEILKELCEAINAFLSAKGMSCITPTTGPGGVKAILGLIPDKYYSSVITHLCTMQQQSNCEIVPTAAESTSNNKRTNENITPPTAGSSKRSNNVEDDEATDTAHSSKKSKVVTEGVYPPFTL